MSTAKAKREERASIGAKMNEMVTRAKSENRPLNVEELEQFDRMNADVDRLDQEARGLEAIEKFENRTREEVYKTANLPSTTNHKPTFSHNRTKDWDNAFRGFLLRDDPNGIPDEYQRAAQNFNLNKNSFSVRAKQQARQAGWMTRTLATNVATEGQELVPITLADQIETYEIAYGGLRSVSKVIRTTQANPLDVPKNDDTANKGNIIAQNSADATNLDTATDLTFSSKRFLGYDITSNIIRVPVELIRDSAFDVQDFVAERLAERVYRKEADLFINGLGTVATPNEPSGILKDISVGLTTASATTFTYAELTNFMYSVAAYYRNSPNACWVMSDDATRVARLLVDSNNRPLWTFGAQDYGIAGDRPDRLLGKPVTVDYNLPTVAAGNKAVMFGDFSRCFWIRDVGELQVLLATERYFEYRQVGIVCIKFVDSGVVNTIAAKAMAQKSGS